MPSSAPQPASPLPHAETLRRKFVERNATVGVIGLGYVGLPLAHAFVEAGFRVLGFDIDPEKIAQLAAGKNYLRHLGDEMIAAMHAAGRFEPTSDFARLAECDAILICVPTPLGKHREPDLTYVERTTADIAATLRVGQLVVLESTTYPGTTRDVVLPLLAPSGLRCGVDFFLAYSPEREDPGRQDFRIATTPKLVGGADAASGEVAVELYREVVQKVVPVRTAEVAESAKLLENIYRAVNIAMVNEMKVVLTKLGIDIWEVIEAAATKPFGFQPFYPGPGLGGHCIPIDPFYMSWKAKEAGVATKFIELAGEINHAMPDYVVARTALALNSRQKPLHGSRILVLGLAYKPDVDDLRESPSLEIIDRLLTLGAQVDYHDPLIPAMHKTRRHDLGLQSIELTPAALRSYDAVIIATHHSAYDWPMIAQAASLLIDTRGVLRAEPGSDDKVVTA